LTGLEIGKCSEPVINNMGDETNPESINYAVFMVSEIDVAREVSEDYLGTLQSRAYADWLNNQWTTREIKYFSIDGGNYDDVTQAWLNYQLRRMREGLGTTEETSET
jgi:hypothetical protein